MAPSPARRHLPQGARGRAHRLRGGHSRGRGGTTCGRRGIVGLHIGPSEAETFWSAFLKTLAKRGLRGTKLVVSDAHEGLKAAIARALTGATWQRCRVALHAQRPRACAPQPGHRRGRRHPTGLRAARPRLGDKGMAPRSLPAPRPLAQARGVRHGPRTDGGPMANWTAPRPTPDRGPGQAVLADMAFPMRHRCPGCTAPTRSSASTERSSAAPMGSASSPPRTASPGSSVPSSSGGAPLGCLAAQQVDRHRQSPRVAGDHRLGPVAAARATQGVAQSPPLAPAAF